MVLVRKPSSTVHLVRQIGAPWHLAVLLGHCTQLRTELREVLTLNPADDRLLAPTRPGQVAPPQCRGVAAIRRSRRNSSDICGEGRRSYKNVVRGRALALYACLVARGWPGISARRMLGGYRGRQADRQQQSYTAEQDFNH
jgi:hypothetical protein